MPHGAQLFLPETLGLVGGLIVFLVGLGSRDISRTRASALITSAAMFVATLATLTLSGDPFSPGIFRVDLFSQLVKLGLIGGLGLVLMLTDAPVGVRRDARVDVPMFLVLATIGMMILASATELLTFYVALEFSAYALYIAVALHRDRETGGEAAAKYVIFGGVASAITIYGASLVVGAVGSTYLSQIAAAFAAGAPPILVVGGVLVLAGILFKLAVVPFHFWAPDVYEGAPHEIVTFVASASKLAAVGVLARFVAMLEPSGQRLVDLFAVLAIVSMTVGNLAAIAQRDVKRLLAYSAVAHAGYLLLGFGALSEIGLASALFYGIVYVAISILAFVIVITVGRDGVNPTIEGLRGLHSRNPFLAFVLLVAMFGLAGIPPTAGFAGKWFLFSAALERDQFFLVLVAAVNSTIALYYYLQLVRSAYLTDSGGLGVVTFPWRHRVPALVAMAVTLIAGIYPAPLWSLAERASALLGGG